MASIQPFYDWTKGLGEEEEKMPVLFIGHGSPMNAIEDNEFSKRWQQMGKEILKPKAVVVVSAHWLTKGTLVTAMPNPKQFTILEVFHKHYLMCNIQCLEILN